MNRRKVSRGLDTVQVRSMYDAWCRTFKAGRPLNRMLTVRPIDIDSLTQAARCDLFAAIRNKLGVYARAHGFRAAFIWSREINKDGTGEHMHVLMFVPARWQADFDDLLPGWFPGPQEMDVRPAGQRSRHTHEGKTLSAINYICKQLTPQAAYGRGIIRKAGGSITGKRGGMTQDLKLPSPPALAIRPSDTIPKAGAQHQASTPSRRAA